MCCASCGIAEVDDVKLKECDGCDLVRYCSDECQELHRTEHEGKCKKRAAELRDEILFRQPEGSHMGDCPICCLPLSLNMNENMLQVCCSKVICNGCSYSNDSHQIRENIHPTCPFCRHPIPTTDEETKKIKMKRAKANDPAAMREMGNAHWKEGDCDRAFKYWTKAAGMGDASAHYSLSIMYMKGEGVEEDETKELYHLEEAVIRGHPAARFSLANWEWEDGKINRAVKHYNIAANLGHDGSLNALKQCYKEGLVSKDDFAAALRAHHAAVKATKSPEREVGEKFQRFRMNFV